MARGTPIVVIDPERMSFGDDAEASSAGLDLRGTACAELPPLAAMLEALVGA